MSRRVKWEPAAAMVAILLVGVALVVAPGRSNYQTGRPSAELHEFKAVNSRGRVEVSVDPESQAHTFRVLTREGHASPVLSEREFKLLFGEKAFHDATNGDVNRFFRFLNITSWSNFLWVAVGLIGQAAFAGRMVVQWFVSEKHKKSVVPEAFWWMSLGGGIMLFAYFVWREDLVGVLGQTSGLVIYARNIRLIYKQSRREREAAMLAEGAPLPTT